VAKKKFSFKPRNPFPNDKACKLYEKTTNAYKIWIRKFQGKKLLERSMNKLAKQITGKWTVEIKTSLKWFMIQSKR
jgi:hypothetical protein